MCINAQRKRELEHDRVLLEQGVSAGAKGGGE